MPGQWRAAFQQEAMTLFHHLISQRTFLAVRHSGLKVRVHGPSVLYTWNVVRPVPL